MTSFDGAFLDAMHDLDNARAFRRAMAHDPWCPQGQSCWCPAGQWVPGYYDSADGCADLADQARHDASNR